MATKTFARKRLPAGLTTSYELKDHMVATDANNAILNPHPQYVLKSEALSGGGGDSNIALHVLDPSAHANYYVQLANITNDYNLDNVNKVTSARAVYLFYQEYIIHKHDLLYAAKSHDHDNYLSDDDLNIHNADKAAHPDLWIPVDHVVANKETIPTVVDNQHVPGFGYFIDLVNLVASHEAGDAIAAAATGPASNNPLRYIFAPRVHTHTLSETGGGAPANHNHDQVTETNILNLNPSVVYSRSDHLHDDRYSMIHSHPYLGDTVLQDVGIYPEMVQQLDAVTDNPDYDPEDEMSEPTITTKLDLNELRTQGQFFVNTVPLNVPFRSVILSASNQSVMIGRTFYYQNESGDQIVADITSSNIASLYNKYGKVSCTNGTLLVHTVTTAIVDDMLPTDSINNTFYRVEQTYMDVSGAVFRRFAVNQYDPAYTLTTDTTFQEDVVYYTLDEDGVFTIATVTPGDEIPELPGEDEEPTTDYVEYYVINGYDESYIWSNWLEYGNEHIFAPAISNRLWTTTEVECKCCYSKIDGSNYVDFTIPDYLQQLISLSNASIEVLLKCNTDISTYGYRKGDVIINPICSNKADNESSFLGHAQTAIITSSGIKTVRLFLPLVWYAKVSDTAAETSVTLSMNNIYGYYRRSFTYNNNGTPAVVVIDASTAAGLIGVTGDFAAMIYNSRTIPIATIAECSEWTIQLRLRY